jgi:hypothetical protein
MIGVHIPQMRLECWLLLGGQSLQPNAPPSREY